MKARTSVPYIFWMAIFVVAPLILVLIYAFSSKNGAPTFDNFRMMADYGPIFTRSFLLAFFATIICLIIGYPLAYVLSRQDHRYQPFFVMLIMLPMWMNFLLRTYAWMSILENNGFLNRFLATVGLPPVSIINTPSAVLLGMVYNYLPFMVLPVYNVLIKIDVKLIEAAQDLGANRRTVFRRVIFPLSFPGVLSGVTMVFVPAVSTFIISTMLGGGKYMMVGDLIEKQFVGAAYNPHLGSAISLFMMLIIIICMSVMNRFDSNSGEEVILP
ncbi:MAG: ABC transporter permease [Bacillota bacterium]|nr:ABC transporter permease [Bacillota bacterium]